MDYQLPKLPSWIKNKYLIVLIAALIWFMFFDQNNLIQQIRMQNQLRDFRQEKQYYIEQIKKDSAALDMLRNNPEALEKYAREVYLMKKPNEDIFIIERNR